MPGTGRYAQRSRSRLAKEKRVLDTKSEFEKKLKVANESHESVEVNTAAFDEPVAKKAPAKKKANQN